MTDDVWAAGDAYEAYVGRWSRSVASIFVTGLGARPGLAWLDAGCGTGALTAAALDAAGPARITGADTSERFLRAAQNRTAGHPAAFCRADMKSIPLADDSVDVTVSGLAINFAADPGAAAGEFARVTAPGGTAAAYVWDYAAGMQLIRHFWDAAVMLDPGAAALDEGRRFPLCRPGPLQQLWTGAGLDGVRVEAIDIPTAFSGFDDYWTPFLGGQGPAPGYAMALGDADRSALRELLATRLPVGDDGTIRLTARAWAVSGVVRA